MFTDDLSETWDSSEIQDTFIKEYFGKRKVSKEKAKDALKPNDVFGKPHSLKKSTKESQGQHCERKNEEVSLNFTVNKTKRTINNPGKGNVTKKKKMSNNSGQNDCIKNDKYNTEQLDNSNNSISLKSKRKKKQKSKNKNNGVIEVHTLLNSSNKTPKHKNDTEDLLIENEETDTISNHSSGKKSLFQNKIYQKFQAAKFRYLNEMLYTNSGKEALSYFQENTEEFLDYHVGYQSQVSKWPINPVDIIIKEISKLNNESVIADLGCGEAKIAEAFPKRTVYSFDLIALKDCVTACDVANVPLASESVDVVVFCLSLMGTNWKDYLREGHRLLKLGAILKIAEIESRIDSLSDFVNTIEKSGFCLVNKNVSHKMFIFLNFKKTKKKVKHSKVPNLTLKPCLYKKR